MIKTLERPRFFPRQLITPDDLTLAHDYLREKLRRMNRYLVGWGVVCGAKVAFPNPLRPWKVTIQQGYILGPYGDEIVIDRDLCFDLRDKCLSGATGDPCDDVIPAKSQDCCGGNSGRPEPKGPMYIAVRYKEFPSTPVRVYHGACGCDENRCEFSRWRDGYEICVLPRCPESHTKPPSLDVKPGPMEECLKCPDDPWVVLARVEVDGQGTVTLIDNCSCRRIVVSMGSWWTTCTDEPLRPPRAPDTPTPGGGGDVPTPTGGGPPVTPPPIRESRPAEPPEARPTPPAATDVTPG